MLYSSSPGLSTAQNNRIKEIERHLHGWERWYGAAVAPSGETHVADRIGATSATFQVDGGNDTWGAWVQILGSNDTPSEAGFVKYDLHRVEITTVERTNATHFIQFAFGASGAAGLAALTYTEFVFRPTTTQGRAAPIDVMTRRQDVGAKAWARVWVVGQNTGTLDFWIGLHQYEV